MIKIVITGAESTGKSTLSEALSSLYPESILVPEYAREYLQDLDRPYNAEDLIQIAKGQLSLEKKALSQKSPITICDTGLLVINIWSQYKYGTVAPWLSAKLNEYKSDLFILPHYDIPYEEDPLRENPEQRHTLFDLYKSTLEELGRTFIIAKGDPETRLQQAQKSINALI